MVSARWCSAAGFATLPGEPAVLPTGLLLLASFVAGDTLSGRVVDRDGHAVPGATVIVVQLHRVALTGTDGAFRFADVPAGRFSVAVRGLGFAPVARMV